MNMEIITSILLIFIFKTRNDNVLAIPDVLLDYCGKDFFEAECPFEKVLLVEEARYGRMQLGSCLKIDLGFMGCSSDVLSLMDMWCSGRQSCRFRVRTIGDIENPCPEEVYSYLQARYTCVKVIIPQDSCCQMPKGNIIHGDKDGFLASSITENTGCGYSGCPWIIQVPMGQSLNISLYDFGTYSSGISPNNGENDGTYISRCHVYAIINEQEGGVPTTICAGDVRVKHVLTSTSQEVQIYFANNQQNEIGSSYFLIGFKAIGCSDPDPPINMLVKRVGFHATIECSSNGATWVIECQDDMWQGDLSDCHGPTSTISMGGGNMPSFITDDVYIVFVVAVTMVISVAIVTTGVVCFQRRRSRLAQERNSKNRNTMSMNYLDGAYAAQEFVYNTPKQPHHHHRENYIYYLTRKEMQDNSIGTPPSTERENDNGYYSDHTYESPQCEHILLRGHLDTDNSRSKSKPGGRGRMTYNTEPFSGTMHGDKFSFSCSEQQPNVGNNTV